MMVIVVQLDERGMAQGVPPERFWKRVYGKSRNVEQTLI